MMTRTTPWDEIKNPGGDINVRLIADSGCIPNYWGKDTAGRFLFIVELQGNHVEQFRKGISTVHGIDVDLRQTSRTNIQWLVLTLELSVDKDLFSGLCETLIMNLQMANDSASAIDITMIHIKRWKAFMAGRTRHVLTDEEIHGLFCELTFMRWLYTNHLDQKTAVAAWCGPDDSHQDFVYDNTAVEVKSLSGKDRSTIRISSEDQLESVCDNLYLIVYRLINIPDANNSISLNDLVKLIEHELSDSSTIEELYRQLASSGYVEMREYDKPLFSVTTIHVYRVIEGFPRIARSRLPVGIIRVKYEVELEKIKQYECDICQLRGV